MIKQYQFLLNLINKNSYENNAEFFWLFNGTECYFYFFCSTFPLLFYSRLDMKVFSYSSQQNFSKGSPRKEKKINKVYEEKLE